MVYERMANEQRPNWFEVMCEKKLRCSKNEEWRNRFVELCWRQWTLFSFPSYRCELWKVRNVLWYDVATSDHTKLSSSLLLATVPPRSCCKHSASSSTSQRYRCPKTKIEWRKERSYEDIRLRIVSNMIQHFTVCGWTLFGTHHQKLFLFFLSFDFSPELELKPHVTSVDLARRIYCRQGLVERFHVISVQTTLYLSPDKPSMNDWFVECLLKVVFRIISWIKVFQ